MIPPALVTVQLLSHAALIGVGISLIFALLVNLGPWLKDFDYALHLRRITVLTCSGVPPAVIGFIVGYLTATSRTGVVGNILPSLLTLLAGLHIYVFGKEIENRVQVSFLATLLVMMVFYGVQYGAYRRDITREMRIQEAIKAEYRIRQVRENLGLPAEMPSWGIGVEAH